MVFLPRGEGYYHMNGTTLRISNTTISDVNFSKNVNPNLNVIKYNWETPIIDEGQLENMLDHYNFDITRFGQESPFERLQRQSETFYLKDKSLTEYTPGERSIEAEILLATNHDFLVCPAGIKLNQ